MSMRFIKILLYIAILLLLFGGYEVTNNIFEYVEQSKNQQVTTKKTKAALPDESVFSLMGRSSIEVKETYGSPNRIDPSSYGYDWWIYRDSEASYFQIGIKNDLVVTIYVLGHDVNMEPFIVGQKTTEVVKEHMINQQVTVRNQQAKYTFEIPESEIFMNPLVPIENGYYAILYFDQFLNELSSVRVVDIETLLMIRPYSVTYQGDLQEVPEIKKEKQKIIDKANEQQILEMTNIIRGRHQLEQLKWNEEVAKVALGHSKDMKVNEYFDHVSPTKGDLSARLATRNIKYQMAGENIAAKYIDAAAAVNGWLNSEGHRKAMLSPDFKELGVGVDELYYTQNFITK